MREIASASSASQSEVWPVCTGYPRKSKIGKNPYPIGCPHESTKATVTCVNCRRPYCDKCMPEHREECFRCYAQRNSELVHLTISDIAHLRQAKPWLDYLRKHSPRSRYGPRVSAEMPDELRKKSNKMNGKKALLFSQIPWMIQKRRLPSQIQKHLSSGESKRRKKRCNEKRTR